MTLKITYKEILLIVGVVVAMAIAVIFWSKGSTTSESHRTSAVTIQKSAVVDLFEKFIRRASLMHSIASYRKVFNYHRLLFQ